MTATAQKIIPVTNEKKRFHALAVMNEPNKVQHNLKNDSIECLVDIVYETGLTPSRQVFIIGHTDIQEEEILKAELKKMLIDNFGFIRLVKTEYSPKIVRNYNY